MRLMFKWNQRLEWGRRASDQLVPAPVTRAPDEALESAIAKERIEVLFQPLIDPRTGEVVGAEALARSDLATSADDLFGPNTKVYQAQIGLSFPLFDNKRLASASAAARARAAQARAAYEGVALNAVREANDALIAVRTARDEAVAQATQANALRQALDIATARYEAGLSSYLDLLDAQRTVFVAELAMSQAQLGELTAAVQLYKALAGSWVRASPAPR